MRDKAKKNKTRLKLLQIL